ncbi:MAG: carboxypeptidase-like regulatory domain-containing protein, partial [Olleya sp.]
MKHQLLILLALIVSININAQSKITGNISDVIGVLSDANITIKGTEKGAVSDLKGNFEIEAKANDTLSISYLGYGTKEIIVDSQKNIDVVLEFDNLLDEVEVVAFSSYKRDMIMCCFFGNTLTCNTKGEKIFKAIAEKPQT